MVPGLTRLTDHGGGKHTPEALTATCRADVEPLHFAIRSPQRTQANAAENGCAVYRETRRSRIAPRQRGEFFGKALKTEIDTDGFLVLAEQAARLLNVAARLRFAN